MTWTLWGYDYGHNTKLNDRLFLHIGPKRYVELHGLKEPIVEILATEDPEGAYHGWLPAGIATPCWIWPSQVQRDMCFPYGPKVAEEKGEGKRMRFTVRAKEGHP